MAVQQEGATSKLIADFPFNAPHYPRPHNPLPRWHPTSNTHAQRPHMHMVPTRFAR